MNHVRAQCIASGRDGPNMQVVNIGHADPRVTEAIADVCQLPREAVWVVFGTNVGTTATGWIVALVGLRLQFEALALPHLDHLYRLAVRLKGSRQDAEDLVQETYIRALRAFATLRDPARIRPWLCQILSRLVLDQQRAAPREVAVGDLAEIDRFSLYELIEQEEVLTPLYGGEALFEKPVLGYAPDLIAQWAGPDSPRASRIALRTSSATVFSAMPRTRSVSASGRS